jgi:hypothetical protein
MKDSAFWNVTVPRAMSIYANAVFVLLWVGFVVALIVNREWLDVLWDWTEALPSVPKILVWVIFLPILVGLWIWESSWPTLGRLAGFAGMLVWTLSAVSSIFRNFR